MKVFALLAGLLLGGCSALASKEATIGCQAADAVTTAVAVSRGVGYEANPIMAHVIDGFGWGGFFILKVALTVALVQLSEKAPKAVGAVNAGTCAVAAHNAFLLR